MNGTYLKTRFAPSPTGLLHLGNVRTALFNYLLARAADGVFLLRIEDTDAARGHERFSEGLQEDLLWLGLAWDQGPQTGGPDGPYLQSQRGGVYARYFTLLEETAAAYRCFCTEHQLDAERRAQLAASRPPRYSGRCRALTASEVQDRLAAGQPATLRFRVDAGSVVDFKDQVRGPQQFRTGDIGDFVIRRSDGTPSFFFSNAIDDAVMGVTLVVRGEDHLANTPRQILILRALGLPLPQYAHIAMVVGHDGSPLSKRTGSRSVQDLREGGFLPLAIANYLARLGHSYDSNDFMPLDMLARAFSIARLHRAPSHFDETQLLHWQKEAVLHAPADELWRWMCSTTPAAGERIDNIVPSGLAEQFIEAVRENVMTPVDAYVWAGNLFAGSAYDGEAREMIVAAGAPFFTSALGCLQAGAGEFRDFSASLGVATGARGRSLFMPLRAALSGAVHDARWPRVWPHGPGLDRIWNLLGPARVRRRLEEAARITGAG